MSTVVLTDGGVWWGPNGEEWKRFSFADIMGVSLARKAGLILALISGEDSPLVDRYAAKMDIADVEKNCKDKARALRAFAERRNLQLSEICFMGDDCQRYRGVETFWTRSGACQRALHGFRNSDFHFEASRRKRCSARIDGYYNFFAGITDRDKCVEIK
jgi:hypothetical protein